MFKILSKAKYDDLLITIAFQESQIDALAKNLKECKRRQANGRFKSNKQLAEDRYFNEPVYGADQ